MKATHGFTLIELLLVVTVIAILASIAYPAYTDYVTRSKVAEATSALSDGRVKMEQFFQDNRTYAGGPVPAATSNFTFARSNDTNTTYTLTATGQAGMVGFTYTINQNNERRTTAAPAGWAAPAMPATCWISKKGGAC